MVAMANSIKILNQNWKNNKLQEFNKNYKELRI